MTSWPDNILKPQKSLLNQQSIIAKTSNSKSNTVRTGNLTSSADAEKWTDIMKQQLMAATNANKALNENIMKAEDNTAFKKYCDVIMAQQIKEVNDFKNQAKDEVQLMSKDAKNTVTDSKNVGRIETTTKDNVPVKYADNTEIKQQQIAMYKKQTYTVSDSSNDLHSGGNIDSWVNQAIEQTGVEADWAPAIKWIINKESNGNPNAQNPSSSAYGLMQLKDETWQLCGFTKTSDPIQQVIAGIDYIKKTYGTADNAKAFWQQNHWY